MAKYSVIVSDDAKRDLKLHYKSGNKAVIKRIERILKELSINPYKGIGTPEELKYDLAGHWSRRINKKDRLIYKVSEDIFTVFIVSASGHYFDT